jgi:hypothetical protein
LIQKERSTGILIQPKKNGVFFTGIQRSRKTSG